MSEVYISVIITAYNRNKFLLDAINSVLNQTLDRDKYEIILIKNFEDKNIDQVVLKNHINTINMKGSIGEYLYAGLNAAKGNIVSFLDDDDMFFENKLEIVYNIFQKKENLKYFHNQPKFIDENNNPIEGSGEAPSFNMSCISIRKNVINIDNLNQVFILPDSFMLYSALDAGGQIISGHEILSYYRLHNSISNSNGDMHSRIAFKNELFQNFISQLEIFYIYFKSRSAKKYILNYMITLKLTVNVFNKSGYSHKHYKIKYSELISYLFIFNYWGKAKRYPLKFFKLLEICLPHNILVSRLMLKH
jgi:glycosyltransferase involved in cell wall biosynthesis